MLQKESGHPRKRFWQEYVVRVQPAEDVTGRTLESFAYSVSLATILL
jgi:hypothetical protein